MAKKGYIGGPVLTESASGLKKKHFSVFAMVFFIYCACAGGAFGIESMIPAAGPGLTLLLLIIIAIFWGLPIGLCSSELSCLAPVESGPYVWTKMAFGEFWGFAEGVMLTLAWYFTGCAYVVLAIDYMALYIPALASSAVLAFVVKALIILVFTAVNLRGLEEVSTLSTIFSILILIAFAAVAVVGFCNWEFSPIDPFINPSEGSVSSWGVGIAIGIWMFCGYSAISSLAGEVENISVLPKAMKIGIVIITLSYVLPTLGGIVSTGPWQDWGTTLDYSSVLFNHVGKWAGIAFMIIAVIAQLALFNATITVATRSFMGMAKDHLCPKFLSKLTKNTKQPFWPIIILAALNIILVNFNFEVLITILTPLLFVFYVIPAFAFIKLRRDYPTDLRGDSLYFVKGGKAAELYVCGGPLLLGIIGMLVNGTEYFLLGWIGILLPVVLYFIFKPVYGGLAVDAPDEYPLNPKTKLGKGDIWHMGIYVLIMGAFCFLGSFFLTWYEGSWGAEYYLETYQTGIMSNFWLMIRIARWAGLAITIIGILMIVLGRKMDPGEKRA